MAQKDKLISAEEMANQGRHPAILHFRPTHYRKVESPEVLKQWVKLVIDLGNHIPPLSDTVYYETTCGTGDFDDCAEEDPGEQPSD